MNKNIASLTVAFNEEDLIGGCLELLNTACKLVLINKTTFSGKNIHNFDSTEKIAKEKGAKVIKTDIKEESDIRNFGLATLHDLGYKYTLIVDSDEYWPSSTQKEMFQIIADKPAEAYKANLSFFFKRPYWKIEDMPNPQAIVAIRTDKRLYPNRPRKFTGNFKRVNPGVIYHFSYVRKPEKIKEKLASFSHSEEIIRNWYNDVYLKFTPKSINFHPVHPNEYPRCIECELPEEIASKIPSYLW